ncbi:hypothetical protein PLESTB_000035100 [Pleodorina starrii]|uniref:Uncharacterized protein n=1 Tax=Pleodorina starrii TaxID=330485 RepID=A0A9W6B8P9_9CHLO|nr:hypothetical protein PLESTB_000035100 [Pleodorina starrii]GLC70695.1 hypothetical protein PLESTF_001023400 [Pleodorina starrii]
MGWKGAITWHTNTITSELSGADGSVGAARWHPPAPRYSPNDTRVTGGCDMPPPGEPTESAPCAALRRYAGDGQTLRTGGTRPSETRFGTASCSSAAAAAAHGASPAAGESQATTCLGGDGGGDGGGGCLAPRHGVLKRLRGQDALLPRRCPHRGGVPNTCRPECTGPPGSRSQARMEAGAGPPQQQQLGVGTAVHLHTGPTAVRRGHTSALPNCTWATAGAARCSSSGEADPEGLPYGTSHSSQWRQQPAPACGRAKRQRQQQWPCPQRQPEQQRGRPGDHQPEGRGPPPAGAVAETAPAASETEAAAEAGAGLRGTGDGTGVASGAAGGPWVGRGSQHPAVQEDVLPLRRCENRGGGGSDGGGRSSGRCGGRRRGGAAARRPPSLLLSLLLAVALPGLLVSGPCTAAAEWSWILAKSRAASGAIGGAAAAAAPAGPGGWSFSGLLPYGWRKHGDGGGSSSALGGKGRGGSSSSRKGRDAGPAAAGAAAAAAASASAAAGGVTFSAGIVSVAVNPAGNVTELLEYDPYTPPPPSPSPPGPPGSRKPKSAAKRRGGGGSRGGGGPRLLSDAQLALRELLTAEDPSRRPPYDIMKPYKLPAVSYKTSDFVFATGSFPARYILAQSTRSWRRGIRAFVAVNNTEDVPILNERNRVHNEHFAYFPDDGTFELGPIFHGFMAGDTRAAMAPFLAHEHFGESYKWMLYGDDDTVFYMPAVKRLLAHLDPELPIALSDNLWFRARHPNLFAPRCLPCHLAVDADPPPPPPPSEAAEAAARAGAGTHSPHKPLRIPNITAVMEGYQRFLLGIRSASELESAKVQKLLTKNTFGEFNKSLAAISHLPPDASLPGVRYLPRPACPFCTAHAACTPLPPTNHNVSGAGCFAGGGHGGAGMIFSVGMLRRLTPERMKACYLKILKAPGGDGMLSACLWEAGYAFTDPGASTLARYDGNYLLFSSEAAKWALHDPLAVLLRGKCDARCKWLLRNAASHHGRGRHFQNFEQSAAYLYANMASYTATHKWLAFMAGRDGDLEELEQLTAAAAAAGAAGEGDEGGGSRPG